MLGCGMCGGVPHVCGAFAHCSGLGVGCSMLTGGAGGGVGVGVGAVGFGARGAVHWGPPVVSCKRREGRIGWGSAPRGLGRAKYCGNGRRVRGRGWVAPPGLRCGVGGACAERVWGGEVFADGACKEQPCVNPNRKHPRHSRTSLHAVSFSNRFSINATSKRTSARHGDNHNNCTRTKPQPYRLLWLKSPPACTPGTPTKNKPAPAANRHTFCPLTRKKSPKPTFTLGLLKTPS